MIPTKGYYSLVQYCPDLARGEATNIGIVLLVPERGYLRSRLVRDNSRVRHMFGTSGDALRQLNDFKRSFVSRIEAESVRITDPEALQQFIDTRGNFIQLTPPRFVKVRECEEQLNRLFDELVGAEKKKKSRESLETQVGKRFAAADLERYLRHDIRVTVPHANRDIRIPFGFQNGHFNLLQVASFESSDDDAKFRRACVQSMQGKFLQEIEDNELGKLSFNVIGRFAGDQDQAIPMVRETLAENNVRLFLEKDLSDLVDEIRRTGKAIK